MLRRAAFRLGGLNRDQFVGSIDTARHRLEIIDNLFGQIGCQITVGVIAHRQSTVRIAYGATIGPASQTERFLLEKARRDSRILNIYEGTNEVQRFLILKDLIAMAADWPELPERLPERPADERAMTLARWKNRVRRHARAAADLLGDAAWADAMLQPALFRLAEMAGEVLRLECVWYRVEWLEARRSSLGERYVDILRPAGERAAARALGIAPSTLYLKLKKYGIG